MYPSDNFYTYALGVDNNCYNNPDYCDSSSGKANGWIYDSNFNQWSLSTYSNSWNVVFALRSTGYISGFGSTYTLSVRPTLYLKSSAKIVSGDGSEQNPYKLSM